LIGSRGNLAQSADDSFGYFSHFYWHAEQKDDPAVIMTGWANQLY
jgi:heme-degrading monooxygenase HmoA